MISKGLFALTFSGSNTVFAGFTASSARARFAIPVADATKGFVPKIFVEMEGGVNFDSVAIRSYLAANLEPYKVPVHIVQIEKIPRSYNGKLLRKELK